MEPNDTFAIFTLLFSLSGGLSGFLYFRFLYYRKKYRQLKKQKPNEFLIFTDEELDLTFNFLMKYHEKKQNYERAAQIRDLNNAINFRADADLNNEGR